MPAKKPHPRNKTLPVAIADIELDSLRKEAERRGVSASDLAHSMMRECGLLKMVASYFPSDVPLLEQNYTNNENQDRPS